MKYLRLALLIFLSLGCRQIFSQDISLESVLSKEGLYVAAYLNNVPHTDVLSSLHDGMEAEISFQLRLYERTTGFLSFLGDRLIIEKQPCYNARINFFDNTYKVRSSDGDEHSYATQAEFIANYFKVESFLTDFRPEKGKEYYIRARILYTHVKLLPPLNLIYLFAPVKLSTEWSDREVVLAGGNNSQYEP